ncbi:hypothetical protein LWI29_032676 [Acer saccharum]|uniref:Uncharacterized protein n=1 Tax=Acer saccharum TaxID=4024 RepID=A0AA39SVU3_ACESA|nr:hypothetical protein LWI29_032676 [Acer saccharum]
MKLVMSHVPRTMRFVVRVVSILFEWVWTLDAMLPGPNKNQYSQFLYRDIKAVWRWFESLLPSFSILHPFFSHGPVTGGPPTPKSAPVLIFHGYLVLLKSDLTGNVLERNAHPYQASVWD